jgi:hypothetical protein
MTTETELDIGQKCSLFSRVSGDDPIGQARFPEHQVFIEARLPWVFNFAESEHVSPGVADVFKDTAAAKLDVALLGMVPDGDYTAAGKRRVFVFSRPVEGLFSRFEKLDYLVPDDRVAGLLRALFLSEGDVTSFAAYRQESDVVREMFVCTHGARDACCATFGYPVYDKLRSDYAYRDDTNIRVWRTSHTGGHRFAPTVLDYPVGRYWARLDLDVLDAAVYHTGDIQDMHFRTRGWSGLGRMEQVVDREILLQKGWKWADYLKRGLTSAEGTTYETPIWLDKIEEAEVRIEFASPDGKDTGTYVATLVHDGEAPFGGCGKPLKLERQFKVTSLERLAR